MAPPNPQRVIASTRNCRKTLLRARTDGHAQTDLARSLGDGNEHDVHDADAADEQAHRRHASQETIEDRLGCSTGSDHLGEVAQHEWLVLGRRHAHRIVHDRRDILLHEREILALVHLYH